MLLKKRNKIERKNKVDYGADFVPPDGGWGWIVCVASGFTNVFMFPVFQFFGIIFRDTFKRNGITDQQSAIMINVQMGIAALSGFFYAPIFKTFTFRKVAIFGSLQLISGIYFLSLTTNTFALFFFVYAFYMAIGKEMIITAKQMAFNTYFKLKRRKALSIVAAIPSLGNWVMPIFVTYLVYQFTTSQVLFILCALAGNVLVASLTYQPVKWHVKQNVPIDTEKNISTDDESINESELTPIKDTTNSEKNILNVTKDNETTETESNRLLNKTNENGELFNDKSENKSNETQKQTIEIRQNNSEIVITEKRTNICQQWYQEFYKLFDIDLLKDLSFLNICFGMTCAMIVEQNFKILAPFFLEDFGYSDRQIAFAMSISYFPDLGTKLLIPHILDWFKIKFANRTLWIFCMGGMIIGEIMIALNPSYEAIVGFMLIEGIFSGAKSIFTGMLIPDHVDLKKMPAAFGINRLINGVCMLTIGFLIGGIKKNYNFTTALLFLTSVALLPIILWIIEKLFKISVGSTNPEINQ